MRKHFITALFIICLGQISAQNQSDSITFKKGIGYSFHGVNGLRRHQLLDITKSNSEANKEMEKADINYFYSTTYEVTFFLTICYYVLPEYSVNNNKIVRKTTTAEVVLDGLDIALLVAAFPLIHAGNKHLEKAVKLYNSGLKQTGMNNIKIGLGLTNNGIGVNMKF